jgi:tight adherence protein C
MTPMHVIGDATTALSILASIGVALAIGLLTRELAQFLPRPAPVYGRRGERYRRLLATSGLFALSDPLIRQMAAWVAAVPWRWSRPALDERLVRGGYFLGLGPDEFVAFSALLFFVGGDVAAAVAAFVGDPVAWAVPSALVAASIPYFRLSGAEQKRKKEVSRALPATIDVVALCMSAGLDFAGALRVVVADRSYGGELDVGHTRAEALRAFGERVHCAAVREFVAATVQAEEKGNPLVDVLRIQANVLRSRRSVTAEEAAARAGVLMVIPVVLLLACILILLFSPFVVRGGL